MAKLVVQHNEDPSIGIVLEEGRNGVQGWSGTCTECGWPMHRWNQGLAVESARKHIETHESGL